MLQRALLRLIRGYQKRGGSRRFFNLECNFEPSCSQYTYEAIEHLGVWRGVKVGLARIRRCNDPDCVHKMQDPFQVDHVDKAQP